MRLTVQRTGGARQLLSRCRPPPPVSPAAGGSRAWAVSGGHGPNTPQADAGVGAGHRRRQSQFPPVGLTVSSERTHTRRPCRTEPLPRPPLGVGGGGVLGCLSAHFCDLFMHGRCPDQKTGSLGPSLQNRTERHSGWEASTHVLPRACDVAAAVVPAAQSSKDTAQNTTAEPVCSRAWGCTHPQHALGQQPTLALGRGGGNGMHVAWVPCASWGH